MHAHQEIFAKWHCILQENIISRVARKRAVRDPTWNTGLDLHLDLDFVMPVINSDSSELNFFQCGLILYGLA